MTPISRSFLTSKCLGPIQEKWKTRLLRRCGSVRTGAAGVSSLPRAQAPRHCFPAQGPNTVGFNGQVCIFMSQTKFSRLLPQKMTAGSCRSATKTGSQQPKSPTRFAGQARRNPCRSFGPTNIFSPLAGRFCGFILPGNYCMCVRACVCVFCRNMKRLRVVHVE